MVNELQKRRYSTEEVARWTVRNELKMKYPNAKVSEAASNWGQCHIQTFIQMNTEQNYVGRASHANTVEQTVKTAPSKSRKETKPITPLRQQKTSKQKESSMLDTAIRMLLENIKPSGIIVNIKVITRVTQSGTGNALNAISADSKCRSSVTGSHNSNKREMQLETENATLRSQLAILQQSLDSRTDS